MNCDDELIYVHNERLIGIVDKLPELFPIGSRWYSPGGDDTWEVIEHKLTDRTPERWPEMRPLYRFVCPTVRMYRVGSDGNKGIRNVGEWVSTGWFFCTKRKWVDKWEEYTTDREFGDFDLGDLAGLIPIDQWLKLRGRDV